MIYERIGELQNREDTSTMVRKHNNLTENLNKKFEELVQNEKITREEKIKRYREKINYNAKEWAEITGLFKGIDRKNNGIPDEELNLEFDIAEELYHYGNKKDIKLKMDDLWNTILQGKRKR